MVFKGPKSAVSNQRGFTLVELITVIGILSILAAIALMQISEQKAKALDTQVVALTKNLLTAVAIDEPTVPGYSGTAFGGTLAPIGLPQVTVPDNVTWNVINDTSGGATNDMWLFWFAHSGGKRGYYFWIPGDACNATLDIGGNLSDSIFYDVDTGSGTPYRTSAGI